MNVSLTPQLEDLIKNKVATGRYHSASEVVRDALRLLEERDAMQAMKLESLRHDIGEALHSMANKEGRPLDVDAIKRRGRAIRCRRAE